MNYTDYDALMQRSNEINAEKINLNRLIDKGKNTVKVDGKRVNIAERIRQLNEEHIKIIKKLNESHEKSI